MFDLRGLILETTLRNRHDRRFVFEKRNDSFNVSSLPSALFKRNICIVTDTRAVLLTKNYTRERRTFNYYTENNNL